MSHVICCHNMETYFASWTSSPSCSSARAKSNLNLLAGHTLTRSKIAASYETMHFWNTYRCKLLPYLWWCLPNCTRFSGHQGEGPMSAQDLATAFVPRLKKNSGSSQILWYAYYEARLLINKAETPTQERRRYAKTVTVIRKSANNWSTKPTTKGIPKFTDLDPILLRNFRIGIRCCSETTQRKIRKDTVSGLS